jgi:factor associated with neutral sphingomyelinase activation
MSNYDYLMYLNIMGGRSFDDLGQYPIMPWVISNYEDETLDLNDLKNFRDLSKPIGALNPKRLKALKDNYQDLKEQGKEFPYIYGTYYSFPYIVFYYLIRTHPLYFLRFQGGSFGPSDRLFYSIKESWNSSVKSSGSQDVKELTPEFYNSEGDFLKNILSLNFGKTQLDELVSDVVLPKWANSPKDFVTTMRAALESEIVSSSLHLWIDLVFGYRQRGEKALEADNLFHPLRYDDMLHLVLDKSEDSRQGDIDNIFEFGQIPIQHFLSEPHPKKRSKLSLNEIRFDSSLKSDSGLKASRLKKDRVNIEKKYEKERRQKDLEIEDIQKKLEERQKEFMEQIKGYDE